MISAVVMISACAWLSLQEESGLFPTQLVLDSGFRVIHDEESEYKGAYVADFGARRSLHARALLSASCQFMMRHSTNGLVESNLSGGSVGRYENRMPSGLPLGIDVRCKVERGTFITLFSTFYESGHSRIALQGSDEKGFYKPPAHDWTQDQQLMERFLRYSLARIAGRRLGSITTSLMAGASIPSATCGRTNAKFGDLRSWCSAKGWTVTEDKTLGVLTVKRGATFAVVPMGTAWVKWDGATWTKVSDVVMEKDGRVMAPKDVLDRLNTL